MDAGPDAWAQRQSIGSVAPGVVETQQLLETQAARRPQRPPEPSPHERLTPVLAMVQQWEWEH